MGIFKHLQNEIDDRENREGITLAELLDLSPSLRRLMNRVTRQGELSVAAAADYLEMPRDEVREMMDSLVKKGYLDREEREEGWIYKTRFAHKRGRSVPVGIWSALSKRADDEQEEGDEE
ncbi:MAG: MarR family transcriptional regulator [Anaerolineales bacterium]